MPLDPDDIAAMYGRHAGELLRFLARRTFDPDAAMDLLAETFAAAFEDRGQFRGDERETARAWLFAIARRRLLDFYRSGRIERRALAKLCVERRALTDSEYDRIEELAVTQALRSAIGEQLERLSETDRELLRLRVVDEWPYVDVARALGISEEAARARASRALRVLRDAVAPDQLLGVADE
jgi:RNA polymerase sigma-70 factor (ECF subfamily)